MKISQLRQMSQSDKRILLSEIKGRINHALVASGYDMSQLYQEIEMDSQFIDTHDDISHCNDNVHLHSHRFYELLYCQSGNLEYLLGAVRYQVRQGDIIYIPPGTSHCPLFSGNKMTPYRRCVIWLSTAYAASLKRDFPDQELLPSEPFLLSSAGTIWDNIEHLFKRGIAETQRCKAGWEVSVYGNTLQILVLLLRARTECSSLRLPLKKRELLDDILLYIETHLACNISLNDTAHLFFVSGSAISQLFRKQLNVSFYHYVTQRRLISAKDLLLDGVCAQQAGNQSGFKDYSTFYRAFKNEYGFSPREYCRLMEK